ncbi:MAG: transposase [Candidatus Diapherotrites archaeon]|nr:transposase [Candidatus Diapherotrites archaeon]
MHAFRRHKGWAYRDTESASQILLGFFIDHSWVGRTLKRIPPIYFIKAVQMIAGRIKALLVKYAKTAHIVDSTGITTGRKTISKKGNEYMYFMKLHIIIKYWLRLGILVIVTCLATGNNVQDGTGMRRMLPDVEGDGNFFGDKGYSGKRNRKKIRQRGFTPQIKPKGELSKKEAEKNPFNNDAYKQIRGRIECVFGGTTTRHDNKTKCRLEATRQNDCNLYAFSHNLQALKQALIIKITLIWRQPLLTHNL